jgi:predicted HTH domain antitoxin
VFIEGGELSPVIGRLSQSKAAEMAGLSRHAFIHELTRFGVAPIQETVEELAEGLAHES